MKHIFETDLTAINRMKSAMIGKYHKLSFLKRFVTPRVFGGLSVVNALPD
jgi:hypothetical protein